MTSYILHMTQHICHILMASVQYQSSKQLFKIIICRIMPQFYTKKLYLM